MEDEFDAWLGRARYERRSGYQRELRNYEIGLRNGFRPRTLQTAAIVPDHTLAFAR